jgi:hypothetical protein
MNEIENCKRIIEIEIEKHGFTVCKIDAVPSTGGQIIARVTTTDGKTADGTQQMFVEAISRAAEDGVSLEEVLSYRNMYAPSI